MFDATDSRLMAQYARGDEQAFEALYRRYEGRTYAYFLRRARSPDTARDLYQDLFLRIHRFRARFDPTQRFEPWFFTIANHVFVEHLRRQHGFEASGGDSLEPVSWEHDGERQAIAREQTQRILTGLAPEHFAVLVAAKVGGFEYAEIAAELGKTVDAVKQTASRAMRRLRALNVQR